MKTGVDWIQSIAPYTLNEKLFSGQIALGLRRRAPNELLQISFSSAYKLQSTSEHCKPAVVPVILASVHRPVRISLRRRRPMSSSEALAVIPTIRPELSFNLNRHSPYPKLIALRRADKPLSRCWKGMAHSMIRLFDSEYDFRTVWRWSMGPVLHTVHLASLAGCLDYQVVTQHFLNKMGWEWKWRYGTW